MLLSLARNICRLVEVAPITSLNARFRSFALTTIVLVHTVFLLMACTTQVDRERKPDNAMFDSLHREILSKSNTPVERHLIDGKTYYFLRAPCCDRGGNLYDAAGNYICNPNGGFAGQGDGRCLQLREKFSRSRGEAIPNPFFQPSN